MSDECKITVGAMQAKPDWGTFFLARSPIFIKIALDLYCEPERANSLYHNSSSVGREVFEQLISRGILERLESGGIRCCGHDALKMYAEALGRVPLPERKWVMP